MIPEAVERRLRSYRRPRSRASSEVIASGDIRATRARDGSEERLVLVLAVDGSRNIAQVTLVHPYVEYATDHDMVLDHEASGLGFRVVVEADLRGSVWLVDLDRRLSNLPRAVVEACLDPERVFPDLRGVASGAEVFGPLDDRYEFKRLERESLAAVCAECTSALLDGLDMEVGDTGVSGAELTVVELLEAMLAGTSHSDELMAKANRRWQTLREPMISEWDEVEVLAARGLLEFERWLAAGDAHFAFFAQVVHPQIDCVRARVGVLGGSSV